MKEIILILSLFAAGFSFGQKDEDEVDLMLDKMCVEFTNSKWQNDSIALTMLNNKYIQPYLAQFSDAEWNAKGDYLFYRFQKRCPHFKEFLKDSGPRNLDDWLTLDTKPSITVTDDELAELKKAKNVHYFDYGGKKTSVELTKTKWKESFGDGSFSSLNFQWKDGTKFELEFISSTNEIKKNYSRKGDKYYYEVVSKENGYYWVLNQSPGREGFLKFKLYID